jgi:general L-amino acid transport system permease protein
MRNGRKAAFSTPRRFDDGGRARRVSDGGRVLSRHSGPSRGLSALLHNRRVRGLVVQAGALAAVLALSAAVVGDTLANLKRGDITSGFGFLNQTAGFDVAMSLIPFDATRTYGRVLIVGALNTLLVAAMGIGAATVLGAIVGVLRLSTNWLIARLAAAYVEIVRNVPLLLQILFWYNLTLALPKVRDSVVLFGAVFNNRGIYLPRLIPGEGAGWVIAAFAVGLAFGVVLARALRSWAGRSHMRFPVLATGVLIAFALPLGVGLALGSAWTIELPQFSGFNYSGGLRIITSLAALWLALTLYTAGFIAEIVRAGIGSVPAGQREAGEALGLKPGVILSRIVLPQALRVIVPPLTSQYLNLFKNSSLAVAVGYPDIVQVFMGTVLNQTGQAIEVTALTMGFYLAVSLVISLAMNLYNRAAALRGAG